MKLLLQAVMHLDPDHPNQYSTREIIPDRTLGIWGEKIKLVTSTGHEYTVSETDDGNLELIERGARTLFTHNRGGNVVEIMAVPLFTPHIVPEQEKVDD